mgnify:CR=1 FL=1|jgi:hypothetical protein
MRRACVAPTRGGGHPRTHPSWQQQTTFVGVAPTVCSGVTGSTRVSPETTASHGPPRPWYFTYVYAG